MERDSKQMLIPTLDRLRTRGKIYIPEFQRDAVWSRAQQRLLVDTILRDLDIPKIYFREVLRGDVQYEVIDGQQRLKAVFDFCAGKFKIESTKIDGKEVPSVGYEGLSDVDEDLRVRFDTYGFNVIVLRDATDDEVEDMFLRLQNGTPLNAPEKRNAMPGNMRNFIRALSGNAFFRNCGFKDHRYAFAHVASQMVRLELGGGPCNIKKPDLDKMYKDGREFDENSTEAKEVRRTLKDMLKAFPEKTPELEKHNAISMFLLFRHLRKNFVIDERHTEIGEWFVAFEKSRLEDAEKPVDERDGHLVAYQEKTRHSTDSQDSLEYRQDVLRACLFEAIPDLRPLARQRNFTDGQKRAIWRRDKGLCQLRIRCDGTEKLGWDDSWHADHKKPWGKGGETTVKNGQVACAACNLAKGGGE